MAFQLDKAHAGIDFSVRHMMISKVRGRFDSFDGVFNLDPVHPERSTFDVTIDAASISTRDAQRDGHLKSADFFDVETYPSLRFVSTKVEVTSKDTAKLYGDLTIRDVTKPVVLDVEFTGSQKSPWGNMSYGFEATTKINRKDWGLTWNVGLETGGVLVGEEITIHIELELVQVAETQAEAAAVAA